MNRVGLALLVAGLLSACGDDESEGVGTDAASDAGTGDAASDSGAPDAAGNDAAEMPDSAAPIDATPVDFPDEPLEVIGGDRPAGVTVPSTYTEADSWPVVLLLHGFGASGIIEDGYLGVSNLSEELGFLVVVPDGTVGPDGSRFWNGTPACCDFGRSGVDDVAYMRGLIEELSTQYNVDPRRVYAFGHSNGGFMSYRLACEASDVFVAIASLAGASYTTEAACAPSVEPVSVLQIHGTDDGTISYEGGNLGQGQAELDYPGAEESVALHASINGCGSTPTEAVAPLDLEVSIPGEESTAIRYADGCADGTLVELWTIDGGGHIPTLSPTGTRQILEWLLERSR